jgi:general L-amino acid transport system permease protein
LAGLVIYTAAFIAEVVRGGIQAVRRGQLEAARALGLSEGDTLRLVVFPQALRVIVPPLTSQYLNLAKNSSLAIAVGYPDLFKVGTTMANQTGQPVPVIALVMGTYLAISLTTSLLMNLYNRRVQVLEG